MIACMVKKLPSPGLLVDSHIKGESASDAGDGPTLCMGLGTT